MWAIGNNLNSPGMYGADPLSLGNIFSLVEEMAQGAHAADPNHPVSAPLADTNLIATIADREVEGTSLDLWGANVYRGGSFETLFIDYRGIASGKPLVILEYGVDAYDSSADSGDGAVDEASQANSAAALWNEIEANSDICDGGTIMEYSDQWWEGKLADPPCSDATVHDACGSVSSAMPDGFDNYEWWGLVDIADSGLAPDTMTPRAVYGGCRTCSGHPKAR